MLSAASLLWHYVTNTPAIAGAPGSEDAVMGADKIRKLLVTAAVAAVLSLLGALGVNPTVDEGSWGGSQSNTAVTTQFNEGSWG